MCLPRAAAEATIHSYCCRGTAEGYVDTHDGGGGGEGGGGGGGGGDGGFRVSDLRHSNATLWHG